MKRISPRWVAGIVLGLGFFALADRAFAQVSIHRNAFETKTGWIKGGFDAPYEETGHRIDDRDPHNGRGSELIEIDAKQGTYAHYVYYVGKAAITEELHAGVWVRANRAGMKLLARVVLPKETDPNNVGYVLTTYIEGDSYQQPGQWQLVEIGRPVTLAKKQQQLMNASLKREVDFSGAYIDALVMNVYAGPGPTKVWIDDLEIGPIQSGPQVAVVPDNNNPGKTVVLPKTSKHSPVYFEGNRLLVGSHRMLFRGIRYTDTMLPVLRNAGFNTIFFDGKANPAIIREASDAGLWIVPEFRIAADNGTPLSADQISKQVMNYAENDSVLFQLISGILSFEQAAPLMRARQA